MKTGYVFDIMSNFQSSLDGDRIRYARNGNKWRFFIKKFHSGPEQDWLNFSQDMRAAMEIEDEQREQIKEQ